MTKESQLSNANNPGAALSQVPLPRLLGSVIDGLLHAQDQLNRHASERATEYVQTPSGTLAMPPLWYAFDKVRVDLEMSATVASVGSGAGTEATFLCRLVNPAAVSLFGYQASSGLRISMELGVMGAIPLKTEQDPPA